MATRLLVTRFAPHAQRLADKLSEHGVFCHPCPLLEVKESPEFTNPSKLLEQCYDYIIAVSPNAVNYTIKALGDQSLPDSHYLAVGASTQSLLAKHVSSQVEIPEGLFDSEGLLSLPSLTSLHGKRILILRGVGGRELLADTLTERGAIVDYYQPYQRVAVDLDGQQCAKSWQQKQINSVLVSSLEILQQLQHLLVEQQQWLLSLHLYVPSERVYRYAKQVGWSQVTVLKGISDQQVIDYFT